MSEFRSVKDREFKSKHEKQGSKSVSYPDDTVTECDYIESSSDEDKKSNSHSTSKFTHSRFSSNAHEIDLDPQQIVSDIGEGIEKSEFQVALSENKRKLVSDPRNLLKKKKENNNAQKPEFNNIESVQQNEGEYLDENSPNIHKAKKLSHHERESMVLMGSKDLEGATKKKQKKTMGVGFGAI